MIRKIGRVEVDKHKDYDGKIIKALENAGFIIVQTSDEYFRGLYDIAEELGDDGNEID